MNDEDALLRAVIDAPDDDAPRLVYADWLDEHGLAKNAAHLEAAKSIEKADDTIEATAVGYRGRDHVREGGYFWRGTDARR